MLSGLTKPLQQFGSYCSEFTLDSGIAGCCVVSLRLRDAMFRLQVFNLLLELDVGYSGDCGVGLRLHAKRLVIVASGQ